MNATAVLMIRTTYRDDIVPPPDDVKSVRDVREHVQAMVGQHQEQTGETFLIRPEEEWTRSVKPEPDYPGFTAVQYAVPVEKVE